MSAEQWIHNFPFFSIFLAMLGGILSILIKSAKKAIRLNQIVTSLIAVMSLVLLIYVLKKDISFTFMMGHFEAPWGNQLRCGPLEALMAFAFSLISLLTVSAGEHDFIREISSKKINYFFIMINMTLGSVLALIYTNDIFTAYVFVEINTLASCAMIMAQNKGRSILASVHYLIMSSLGSGLFLMGICILYDVTGHLLMGDMQHKLIELSRQGDYVFAIFLASTLIFIGLAVKSALFPFHTMLPNAYDNSIPAVSGILSGIVLKGYVLMAIKFIFQILSVRITKMIQIQNIFFVFGVLGIVMGSIYALKEVRIKKMLAYSSVAQIGYIYMGIGIGGRIGIAAACMHILVHAATKTALFVSIGYLQKSNGNKNTIKDLSGTGHGNPLAGIVYTIGALSMIGVPIFAGFVSKYYLAISTIHNKYIMIMVLFVLAISMILNATYFLPTVISIWNKNDISEIKIVKNSILQNIILGSFIVINFILGIYFEPILEIIQHGILRLS